MRPADVLVWISGMVLLPASAGGFAGTGGRFLGWPGWFVLASALVVALVFSGIGYSLTTRYFEQTEREREPWRFASRLLSLAVLMFAGVGLGFGLAEGHHEVIRTLSGVLSGTLVYLVLSSVWFGFPQKHERGREVLRTDAIDRKERELRREMEAEGDEGIAIGKRRIPSFYANSHILFTGATRSGKTIQQRLLYQSVLPLVGKGHDHRALILDAKGEMHGILGGMGLECEVRTLNPYDRRSYSWWLSRDITDRGDAETFAELMVPYNPKLSQQHWDETLRGIINQLVLTYIERDGGNPVDWTFRDVIYPLWGGREVLEHVLNQTEAGKALVEATFENDEHAGNVDATIAPKARSFAIIAALWDEAEREGRRLSLEDWGREEYILLLGHSHKLRVTMRTLNQMISKRLSQVILDMKSSSTRRCWLLCDELRQAGRLEGLADFLVEGASKGACMVSGFQDQAGLEHEYEVLVADELIGQHHIIVATKLLNEKTARAVSEKFGEYERWVRKKSYTRERGGSSVTEHEELIRAPSVLPSDLMNLPRPNRRIGLETWNITPLGAYHDHIPGDYIDRKLLPENTDPERGGMPNFLPRDRKAQILRPWTAEDYERLKLPPFVPKPPKPKKGGKPKQKGEKQKPEREERWLELVPDLPDKRPAQASGGHQEEAGLGRTPDTPSRDAQRERSRLMGKWQFPDPDLIPEHIAKDIPKLYATERQKDPVAHVKLFTPSSSWTWYVTEYDKEEKVAFGLVYGHEAELGYFSIEEMQGVRGPMGLPIERDTGFKPKPLSQCEDPCRLHENPVKPAKAVEHQEQKEQDEGEQPQQKQKRGPKLTV